MCISIVVHVYAVIDKLVAQNASYIRLDKDFY